MPARNGLPPAVREVAQERLAALAEGLEGADPALRRALPRVLAASGFVSGVLARDPERLRAWCKDGFFQRAPAPGALARRLHGAVAACEGDEAFMAALRRVRNAELARIALREIAGWARLDETLGELSDLAEAACQAALVRAMQAVGARAGVPRDASGAASVPYVLGMGKLGGRELNFSSDIDLIFGYTAAGETDGARPLANEEFFEKVVQQMTRLLAQRTAEGFVFRVDWMLRPFGSAGPPAMGSAAMEEYYQVHGREWERYAFIKARTVAGEPAAGGALLRALQPFIYRRYLDFNAVGALRELKRTIEAEVARKDLHDNIKLGSGGIREIEFIVQAFQLMRGGKEAPLRDTRLRPVLRYLGQAGHLEPATAAALDADYVFLRRLENALQMQQDAQTHALPAAEADREAVAVALALPDWGAVEEQLAAARARVAAEFARLFAAPAEVKRGSAPDAAVSALWRGGDPAAAREALVKLGFAEDPDGLIEEIRALKDSRLARALSETSLQRLESLVAVLLDELRASARPETAARRVLQVVGAVAGRTTYLALLRESGGARAQLIRLCAASPWIAEFIAGAPAVLDQLLDERTLYAPPEQAELHAELEKRFANVAAGDTEGAMNALRLFRQEMMLRIAAADLVQALPLVKVSDRLTWLAESILARALAANRAEMAAEFGTPRRSDGAEAAFAVIAYGKFGGIEMGYGSDLDIVFLHDADVLDGETEGGGRRLANEVWLSRLAQRIVNWLSAQTALGRAYEVDLELRPDGRRGLTVSSIAGFAQYQRENAWTWEHQALTRARPVAGEARLQEAFAELRREVITRRRDEAKLRADVRDMRARMRRHLDRSTREAFDVKQGEGGLTDIEFITQYLVLRHAHAHPELAAWPDNWRQTDALVAAGVLEAGKAGALIDTYRDYRAWLHARDLQQGEGLADDSQFTAQRAAVRSLWRDLIEGA